MKGREKLLADMATAAEFFLVGAGVACLLVLSYFVYHYGWTATRQFTSWVGVLLYYFLPAVLAVMFFVSPPMEVGLSS